MKLSSYREHAREKPKTRTKEKTNKNDRQKSTLV